MSSSSCKSAFQSPANVLIPYPPLRARSSADIIIGFNLEGKSFVQVCINNRLRDWHGMGMGMSMGMDTYDYDSG